MTDAVKIPIRPTRANAVEREMARVALCDLDGESLTQVILEAAEGMPIDWLEDLERKIGRLTCHPAHRRALGWPV